MPARLRAVQLLRAAAMFAFVAWAAVGAYCESCQTSTDMDDATRGAITSAGQRYFDMVVKGDSASLRQNAIPSLASDFSGIENSVKDAQAGLAGAQSSVRPVFLLNADGVSAIARAEFFCGLYTAKGQSVTSATFVLNNLPAGKYAIVIFEATATKNATAVSFVLQSIGNDWKVGGLYIKPRQYAGHDSDWFINRAREYKAKNQLHNAWFYYRTALGLISPLPFMATQATDKLYDESEALLLTDVPADGRTIDLVAGTAAYKVDSMFLDAFANDLDLVVRYQSADVSNTTRAYQDNLTVAKTVLAKFPEVKDAFAGMVARAVDSNGHDYGTLLAMKDIK